MAGTYDEETKRLLENRRRNAEIRRAEQTKKRNIILAGGAAVIVLIIVIVVICVSCSGKKTSKEKPNTAVSKETMAVATTHAETTTPEETTTAQSVMYTTDVLNLRKKPNANAKIIVQIDPGKKVEILEEDGEWCKVKRGTDVGYLMKQYLSYEKNVD